METYKLVIKNMVCHRCIQAVENWIAEAGLVGAKVELGTAYFPKEPEVEKLAHFKNLLQADGFEVLDDRRTRLVEQVKTLVINEIHHVAGKKPESMNFSEFLEKQTGQNYPALSHLFSSVEGVTIERYIIAQKIERAKELLLYDQLTLSEIAWQLGYTSSQHLSNQFRQVTGLTPTDFKKSLSPHRKPLDRVV